MKNIALIILIVGLMVIVGFSYKEIMTFLEWIFNLFSLLFKALATLFKFLKFN